MSTLRCIQQILLTTVQENASALLCILLEILHTAEKRKQRGSVNIFLEFTPSGGSSAQSIPFMFGALHYIIVLVCKVNLFLRRGRGVVWLSVACRAFQLWGWIPQGRYLVFREVLSRQRRSTLRSLQVWGRGLVARFRRLGDELVSR